MAAIFLAATPRKACLLAILAEESILMDKGCVEEDRSAAL